jgi:DNA-binding beta-propeller fold protein YncE
MKLSHLPRILSAFKCGFVISSTVALGLLDNAKADKIVLFAGGGHSELPAPALEAALHEPFGTAFDSAGNAWIVEMASGNRLLKVDTSGTLTHEAGRRQTGEGGDNGPGLEAQFFGPHNLTIPGGRRILIGDTWNGRLREYFPANKLVRGVAGYGVPSEKAKGNGPYCVTTDDAGDKAYIADLKQVWVLDLNDGKLQLVAGNGGKGIPADGALATEVPLVDPRAVAPDHLGNVYVLERGGHALRVVGKDGRIRTVVNASGKAGAGGDGGLALEAQLNGPKHLCVDRDNSVLIADAENNVIRRYVPETGRLERVAGTGRKGGNGVGGSPLECELARPHGVTVHPKTGELYITDSYNDRVLRVIKE